MGDHRQRKVIETGPFVNTISNQLYYYLNLKKMTEKYIQLTEDLQYARR